MSGRGLNMDLSSNGGGGGAKRTRRPRIPLRTPSTPNPGVLSPSLTPTPVTPQQPARDLIQINIDMEELHIGDKTFPVSAENLVDKGCIGEGHFGIVSKMYFEKSDLEMAVKKIPMKDLRVSDKSSGGEILELAVVMKAKECPFIVQFYGCLVRDGHVWICMELLDSSMSEVADICYRKLGKPVPEDILGKMSVAVVKALHFLQKELRIIHRDVKPSNILVSKTGGFKLCDFGISGKLVDSIARTMEVGCRPYMAPERIDPMRASQGYTIQSDVWSFGITLMEVAMGAFPYGKWSTIFEQLNAVVSGPAPQLPTESPHSQELRDFVAACLIKDPLQRPNYEALMQYPFFKKSDVAQVDVGGWYSGIRSAT